MKKSAIILLIMTLWWILPIFLCVLWLYPLTTYYKSHLLYLVTMSGALIFAWVLGKIDAKRHLWEKYNYWGKYLVVCSAYALQMITIVIVLVTLDDWNMIAYFGHSADGSIGFLFLPSIPIYFLLGAAGGVVLQIISRGKRVTEASHTEIPKKA